MIIQNVFDSIFSFFKKPELEQLKNGLFFSQSWKQFGKVARTVTYVKLC